MKRILLLIFLFVSTILNAQNIYRIENKRTITGTGGVFPIGGRWEYSTGLFSNGILNCSGVLSCAEIIAYNDTINVQSELIEYLAYNIEIKIIKKDEEIDIRKLITDNDNKH